MALKWLLKMRKMPFITSVMKKFYYPDSSNWCVLCPSDFMGKKVKLICSFLRRNFPIENLTLRSISMEIRLFNIERVSKLVSRAMHFLAQTRCLNFLYLLQLLLLNNNQNLADASR